MSQNGCWIKSWVNLDSVCWSGFRDVGPATYMTTHLPLHPLPDNVSKLSMILALTSVLIEFPAFETKIHNHSKLKVSSTGILPDFWGCFFRKILAPK